MADIDNLVIKISAQTGRAVSSVNKLASALDNLNNSLGRIDAGNIGTIGDIATNIGQSVANLKGTVNSLQGIAAGFNNIGEASGQIAQTESATEGLAQSVQRTGEAVSNTAGALKDGAQSAQNLGNSLSNISNNARSAARSLRETGSSSKSSSKQFKGLAKELTRVGKMLKLMVTRMVLRKVIEGVLDGFKNLAQYSATFDATLSLLWNSLRQLGNSIAAAVSPLLNAFAPAINYIIQLCIKAVNVINQLISALTGMGTWTRAKTLTDDYAKSLDKSNKSAKALKKTVLGFDELNQLQDNNSGGGGGTSPKDMFEEVPIDPRILKFLDDLKKKIGELKKYWDAFVKGFKKGLGDDWKDKVALIVDGVKRIQQALKDIWNDPSVSAAREKYFLSLSEMLGAIVGTVARIGLNIGANLAQGIANALESKTAEIKQYLIGMFDIGTEINRQVEEFVLAIGRISDVLVGDNAISATQHFTEIFLEAFMLITENAAKLGSSLITLVTQPIIDNAEEISVALDDLFGILSDFGDLVQTVLKDIRSTLTSVWNQSINPIFNSLTKALSTVVKVFADAWHNNVSPVLRELMSSLKELWGTYLKPLFDDIVHIIATIADLVVQLAVAIIIPHIQDIAQKWFPVITSAISTIISWVKVLIEVWSTGFEQMLFVIRSLLEFIEIGFTQGWDAAWSHLTETFSKHWEEMKEKARGIMNSVVELVENAINTIVKGVNYLADTISDKLSVSFPEWLGGGSFNIEIPHLNEVSLGRFAGGGFIEDGLFTMNRGEIAGRFDNGKSVVANNEQITDGIARAVFSAMTAAQSGGGGQYINNTIMVDGDVIARAVTKGQERLNRRYSPAT